ncbi:hypothetical protein WJX81_000024, partial [Elliptochloris bilobata]
SVGSKELGR